MDEDPSSLSTALDGFAEVVEDEVLDVAAGTARTGSWIVLGQLAVPEAGEQDEGDGDGEGATQADLSTGVRAACRRPLPGRFGGAHVLVPDLS